MWFEKHGICLNEQVYIVMFSYENMICAHIPIFAVLLLDQNIVVDTCNC